MACNISTETKMFLGELDGHIAKLESQMGDYERQKGKNTQAIMNCAAKLCKRINKDADILIKKEETKLAEYKGLLHKITDDHRTHIDDLKRMKQTASELHQLYNELEAQKKLSKLREWALEQAEISIDGNAWEKTIFVPSSLSEWPKGENMVGMVALVVPECSFKHEFDVKMYPCDVNMSHSGTLLVTGSEGGGAEYTAQGKLQEDITGPFGGKALWSAVQTTTGATFVSDENQHKVYFRPSPSSPYTELAPGTFKYPRGIAVSRKNKVGVVDEGNKAIYIFSDKGKLEKTIEISKTGAACSSPFYITFTSEEDMVISDYNQKCLHIISLTGQLICTIGTPGQEGDGPDQLSWPHGVDTDGAGNIICADSNNKRIQLYGRDGKYKTTLLGPHDGMDNPYGVCVTKDNLMIIGEYNQKKIKVYNYKL